MSYLVLDRLSKRFGREQVLQDLSLTVERGETVAVFGPSGCGKTVLLRLLAGVLAPDGGDLRVNGASVTHLPPERRDVGMAFQTFALYPHLPASENIASPLRARRLAQREVRQRVGAVAELLRISHVLDHRPAQLSNGQKQRTALARALVSGPGLLLLDDPLRNVDAKLRYEMRLELPRVLREFESTALYVTQDYKEAMALGDRIGVLYEGRFRQVGTPVDVYRRPVSTRVARLFGDPTVNLLPARVEADDNGGLRLSLGGERLRVPAAFGHLQGRECLLGIRPEDVAVRFRQGDGGLPLELDAVTPVNLRNVLLLRTGDGTELLASTADADARAFGRGHAQVWATLDWGRAMFFDAAGGQALTARG